MKKQNIFLALFFAAFMLLIFGSVSSADPNMAPPGGEHHDPNMPPPGGHPPADCGGVPCPTGDDHHGDQDAAHCRAMGMADGSPHVDPPQDVLDQVQAE